MVDEQLPGLSKEDVSSENYFYSKKGDILQSKQIIKFTPLPTDDDYNYGYINRFFAKQINNDNSRIIEIDENQYNTFLNESNCIYKVISFYWMIKGIRSEVINFNIDKITQANLEINGIFDYLSKKPLQFYREN